MRGLVNRDNGSRRPGHGNSVADLMLDESANWTVVESKDLYRDDWVVALRQDILQRAGTTGTSDRFSRRVLEHPGSAVVLAIDDFDMVVCTRQYRHTLRRRFVELPAGICDNPDEDPLRVAQRELEEEAGLVAQHWEPLSTTCSSLGLSTEKVRIYLARGLEPAPTRFAKVHEEAEMEVFRVPFSELLDAALTGVIVNAQLIIAVMTYQLRQTHTQSNSGGS